MNSKIDTKSAAIALAHVGDEKQAEFLKWFIDDLVEACKRTLRTNEWQQVVIPHKHMQTVIGLGKYMRPGGGQ